MYCNSMHLTDKTTYACCALQYSRCVMSERFYVCVCLFAQDEYVCVFARERV